eukprot:70133_1
MKKSSVLLASVLLTNGSSYMFPSRMVKRATGYPATRKYALTRRYPSSSLARSFDDFFSPSFIDDMMDLSFPSPMFRMLDKEMSESMTKFRRSKSLPRYEINENDHEVELKFDIPGVKAKDLNVEVRSEGKILSITGRRSITDECKTNDPAGDKGKNERERASESRFEKNFSLGNNRFATDKISAKLENGILSIVLPKVEPPKEVVQKISITENEKTEDVNVELENGKENNDLTITEDE